MHLKARLKREEGSNDYYAKDFNWTAPNATKDELVDALKDKIEFDFDEVYYAVRHVPVTDDYNLEWQPIDKNKIYELLVKKHDFSEERVKSNLKALDDYSESKKQTDLGSFF